MSSVRRSDPAGGPLGRIGPIVLLTVLLGVTALGTVLAAMRIDDREDERRAGKARELAVAIDQRMREVTELLYGTAAMAAAVDGPTPREFYNYLESQRIGRRFPGVLGVLHAQLVPRSRAAEFARRTGAQTAAADLDYPPFRIHPDPRRGGPRLLVVDRVHPTRASRAFGLDLLRDRARRAPALRALRTGRPSAGRPTRPLHRAGRALAVTVMVPVAAPGRRPTGVVYGTLRMDLLLRSVFGRLPDGDRVEVWDVGAAGSGGRQTAIPFRLSGQRPVEPDAPRTGTETITVAGRRWTIAYYQPSTDLPLLDRAAPWLVLLAGILVSLLAASLLRAFVTSRQRAVALAERMTRELREREAELQASHAELEHFAYLASHDLQEPLRTITSYAGLLQRRSMDQLDERSQTWLRFIAEGAARMSDLIADLLEYSRTGRTTASQEPTSLEEAWDSAVANLAKAIDQSGATVTRGPLPVVRGRRRELVSLFQNLISNALKYRSEAPPEVRAEAEERDGRWVIRVSDNGIGIDPQFHDRVFGLFQRLHTADEYPGTGMGLAIVRKVAESHGGTVRLESAPGQGSTFVIDLPTRDDSEEDPDDSA